MKYMVKDQYIAATTTGSRYNSGQRHATTESSLHGKGVGTVEGQTQEGGGGGDGGEGHIPMVAV